MVTLEVNGAIFWRTYKQKYEAYLFLTVHTVVFYQYFYFLSYKGFLVFFYILGIMMSWQQVKRFMETVKKVFFFAS